MKSTKMLNKILTLILVFILGSSFAVSFADNTQPAKALKLTKAEENQITSFFKENGVEDRTIRDLLKKFKNGEVWDSQKKEYSNIKPAEILTYSDGTIKEKYVYPDGSIMVSTVGTAQPKTSNNDIIMAASVNGGTWTYGSGYSSCRNALVENNWGNLSLSFYADFTLVNGAADMIDNVRDYRIYVIGGTYSNVQLGITDKYELTNYRPAEAKLSCDVTYYGGTATMNYYLKLRVANDTFWTNHY